ncbi:unnamed protein product [Jaminaea pallidilutea]
MESHLQSLKVPELKQLLTAHSLPLSGNKPDLIQRLLENPEATSGIQLPGNGDASSKPTDAPPAADSSKTQIASPPTAAQGNGVKKSPAPPAAAPATSTAIATAPAKALSPQPPAKGASPLADAGATAAAAGPTVEERKKALVSELEKRKARAARFGQELGETDKKLERALKFGADGQESSTEDMDRLESELGFRKTAAGGAGKKEKPSKGSERKQEQASAKGKEAKVAPEPVKELTEEEKAAKAKADAELEEAKRRRAERFGLVNKEDEEKKRKRAEKFGDGQAASQEPADKKVKA